MVRNWLDWFMLRGEGYQWWSGFGSDLAYFGAIGLFLKHQNCHVKGCWRMKWHLHPQHGHPVCRKHYAEDGAAHGL
jgi:hypothetical protein